MCRTLNGSASLQDATGKLQAYYHCDYLSTTDCPKLEAVIVMYNEAVIFVNLCVSKILDTFDMSIFKLSLTTTKDV